MKFLRHTAILVCVVVCQLTFAVDQADYSMATLKIVSESADNILQNYTAKSIDPIMRNTTANQLVQFFTLIDYFKIMIEVTRTYCEKHKEEPSIKCASCLRRLVPTSRFFSSLAAIALRDFTDGKNNYDRMKKLLDDSVAVVAYGSSDEIQNFMLQAANDIQFSCQDCKAHFWINA